MKRKGLLLFLGLISILGLTAAVGIGCSNQPHPTTNSYCAPGCSLAMTWDDDCDWACNVEACYYDGGECRHYCAEGCSSDMLNNDVCDPACNNENCNLDDLICTEKCAEYCFLWMLNNDKCDMVCFFPECNWDNGACTKQSPTPTSSYSSECAPGCPWTYVGDGNCDAYYCNNAACQYDGGDCNSCATGCTQEMLNNDICDWACNMYVCGFDNGRCSQ